MDTEELYQYNISNNKSLMEKLNWIDNDITYSFNEHGFRSDSFEKHCTILTNGCSQTMGIGLPLEDMWSKQIANHYNTNYHNLAVAGSDFQHLAQRSAYWLPIIKPKIYILKEPPADNVASAAPDIMRFTLVLMLLKSVSKMLSVLATT